MATIGFVKWILLLLLGCHVAVPGAETGPTNAEVLKCDVLVFGATRVENHYGQHG
jgi:hypothetical protein